MKAKLIAAVLVSAFLGFGTAFLVRQPEAQAQGQGRRLVTWEFKVAEFPDVTKAEGQLAQLSADGWEYVGVINARPNDGRGGASFVAFRRPKKAN